MKNTSKTKYSVFALILLTQLALTYQNCAPSGGFATIASTSSSTSQGQNTPQPEPSPQPAPHPNPQSEPQPNPMSDLVSQVSYSVSSVPIPNPERGFYWQSSCNNYPFQNSHLTEYKAGGTSMVRCVFYLNNFKTSAISQEYLNGIQSQMDRLRTHGFKVILRFAYTEDTSGDDASVNQVLSHIDQLAPLLQRNSDVIAYMEAGFIGAWGEWAYSQNFGTSGNLSNQNWDDRKKVVDKLLSVLPANRSIQLRTPAFKMKFFGNSALTFSEAFSGSAKSRVGHLNDCFLASENDWGTYSNKSVEYPYLQEETKYTPMGGETCNPSPPRSSCTTAQSELAMFHWSNLHEGYHQNVIASWKAEGCYEEIKKKLGYRFVLESGAYSSTVKMGGILSVGFKFMNQGYASPFNERKVDLILRNNSNGTIHRLSINTDPRKWLPGASITVNQNITLPSSIPPGSYSLLLHFPDSAQALAARPEYSIQLANTGVWEANTGFNKLNHTLTVSQ